jgi:hypothetical protein
MKKMLFATVLLLVFVCFIVWRSVGISTKPQIDLTDVKTRGDKCGAGLSRNYIFLESRLDSVRKLGEVERMCESNVTDYLTIRVTIPNSIDSAKLQAKRLSDALMAFDEHHLKPLVFFEISPAWTSYDFENLAAGRYDTYLKQFTSDLADNGVRDEYVYGWIIIPRANLPYWNKKFIAPEEFKKYYVVLRDSLKEAFPTSDVGIYLNASTYEETPINWGERDYRSLTPYIANLPENSVDIIGIEGYPWISPVGGSGVTILTPTEYLPKFLVDELFVLQKPKKVIVGTNTFAAMYTEKKEQLVYMPIDVRQDLLDSSLRVAKALQRDGVEVTMLISSPTLVGYESTDWEYFGTTFNQDLRNNKVFLNFLKSLYSEKVGLIFGY